MTDSRFHSMEVSPEGVVGEGLRMMAVKSPALKGRGDITVWIPEGHDPKALPAALLLHGVYGSHWAWAYSGGAHRVAGEMIAAGAVRPMMLVMPSDGLRGDGSGYLAHADGADYEAWIVRDVIDVVRAVFAVPEENPWMIAGLSMGGYGALRLGAKYPGMFRAISAHSSVTAPEQLTQFMEDPAAAFPGRGDDADILYWMKKHAAVLPPLRFDCGRDDILIEENRALHTALTAAGIPHEYEEFAGGHTWDYWRSHLRDTLRFFSR